MASEGKKPLVSDVQVLVSSVYIETSRNEWVHDKGSMVED